MQATHAAPVDAPQGQRRRYRIERRFCGERHIKDVVRDLLRAHSGGQG